jgi:hypothetical protein
MVKVRYDEGLTNHIGPESCVADREGVCEALTGVRAGQAKERRNIILREAHAFLTAEGNTAMTRLGEDHTTTLPSPLFVRLLRRAAAGAIYRPALAGYTVNSLVFC